MNKIILFFVILVTSNLAAQTIDTQEIEVSLALPEVSLVSIKPDNSTIVISMENANVAGEKIVCTSKSENHLWLNYTCSLAPESPSKNLTAQIISGSVPNGLELQLTVSDYTGNGKGRFGTPIPKIKLQNYPQNIISNIGGSYTNQGINNGHELEYTLEISNYKLLDSEKSNTLTILYTLNDN